MTSAKVLVILTRLCLVIALSLIPAISIAAAPPDGTQTPQEISEGAPRLPAPEPEPEEDPEALELRRALIAFDRARGEGADALIALRGTLHGRARDILLPEIADALDLFTRQAQDPLSEASFVSGQGGVNATNYVGINGVACAYTTIQAAINAASSGDTIQLVNRAFSESIDITGGKTLTIVGGYATNCMTPVIGTVSTITGTSGSVVDVNASTVVLRNLNITGGTGFGAGLDLYGANARATLDKTDVYSNAGTQGGGVYVSYGTIATITNDSDIYGNTAALYGGGVAVYGRFVGDETYSDIYDNVATFDGGGIYASAGTVLLNGSDLSRNRALGATGKGGGIFVASGVITLTNNVYIYEGHTAYDGAGIYADASQVYLLGSSSIMGGTAVHYGGGIYLADGSTLSAPGTNANIGGAAVSYKNQAVRGGGIYAINSTVVFGGKLQNNEASDSGGGLYAQASTIDLTNAIVGGTSDNEPNRIGASGLNGAGLYLTENTHATLLNTSVISNTLTNPNSGYGAGLYVRAGSMVTITNSRIERNLAPSGFDGRGAAMYIYGSTVTLDNTDVLSNTAGDLGGAVRLFEGSTLNVINGSIFRANRALDGEGGAIAATSGSTINLNDANLTGNVASTDGGAVHIFGGSLVAVNSTFADGQAANHGGAIASSNATVTISSDFNTCNPLVRQCSTLYGNTADSDSSGNGYGGAIYAITSTLTIDHTYLHHNEAYRGGAIYQDGTSGKLQVQNSLIYKNITVTAFGAGIRAYGGMVTLRHVTIADNQGGAAYSQVIASSTVINSIAWGNNQGFRGTFVTTSCNIDQDGNAGANVNPRFVSSGTSNYHLLPISPAIDACATGLSPDLDNVARPGSTDYDMGAYEFVIRLFLPMTLKN
ncbi:MAG: choice-of-anchor Q domain-containing protein [Anaerolineae bacterium]